MGKNSSGYEVDTSDYPRIEKTTNPRQSEALARDWADVRQLRSQQSEHNILNPDDLLIQTSTSGYDCASLNFALQVQTRCFTTAVFPCLYRRIYSAVYTAAIVNISTPLSSFLSRGWAVSMFSLVERASPLPTRTELHEKPYLRCRFLGRAGKNLCLN